MRWVLRPPGSHKARKLHIVQNKVAQVVVHLIQSERMGGCHNLILWCKEGGRCVVNGIVFDEDY